MASSITAVGRRSGGGTRRRLAMRSSTSSSCSTDRQDAFLLRQRRLFHWPYPPPSPPLSHVVGHHDHRHPHHQNEQGRLFTAPSMSSASSLSSPLLLLLMRTRRRDGTITTRLESRQARHLSTVQRMNEQWMKMMSIRVRGNSRQHNNNLSSSSSSSPTLPLSSVSSLSSSSSSSSRNNTPAAAGKSRSTISASAASFMSLHQNLLYVDVSSNRDQDDDGEYDDDHGHENSMIVDDDFSHCQRQHRESCVQNVSSSSSSAPPSLQSDIDKLTKAYLSQLMPPTSAERSNPTRRLPYNTVAMNSGSYHDADVATMTTMKNNGMSGYDSKEHEIEDDDENETYDYDIDSTERNILTSLDHELGIGSIWDVVEADRDENLSEEHDVDVDSGTLNFELAKARTTTTTTSTTTSHTPPFPFKTPMEMLRSFDSENPPTSGNPLELQLWMECWSQREAVLKHQQLVDKARDRKAYDAMSLMQRHIIKWFEDLRDAIDARQKEYLSMTDKHRAHKRYGPFLCSLHPEKMSVITSQEAIIQSLTNGGKSGLDGVPLVKIAHAIGTAVETEVVSQRRMKERFHKSFISLTETSSADKDDVDSDIVDQLDGTEIKQSSPGGVISEQAKVDLLDKWKFSASHLKLFLDDLEKTGMGRNKRGIQYAMRKAKEAMNSAEAWTTDDVVHVGAALLSILVDHTKVREDGRDEPAFRVEKKWLPGKQSKSQSFIVMHDRLRKAFLEDEYLSWAANTTRYMPMIVPPTDWSGPNEGAYKWLKADLMRTHGSSVQREALQNADLSVVCDGLNILGKTPWAINKKILKIGEYCWDNNIPIGDIPSRTDFEVPPEPERPSYIDPEVFADRNSSEAKAAIEAFQLYNESVYKRKRILQKNMDLRSLRCSATLKLTQAKRFQDFERIYFPYNLDFRGRAYPIPPHLSNVGSDLCRGMLTFADAKPLGKRGLYWLKVHLANFAGMDKISFDDRAKFIDCNIDRVRQSVDNPFSEDPWWMSLDDPFQGLATCHEIINALDSGDPESYMCSLPVHMDGSCNGLQHYAALGRDTVGGKAVNLLQSDGPEDVYVGVMHEVIRRVADEAASDLPFDTSDPSSLTRQQQVALKHNRAAKLVNGLIDRGVVKRTVMTSVYGVTYIGARQQIQEKIEEKLEEKGYDLDDIEREVFAASGYLATITMEVMGDLFQGAKKTKTWLADCARIISQQGHPVAWISPIGVPAIQPYRQRRPRTVVTVMQSVTVVDDHDDLQVHKNRQCTAFPPNYVHSLDSSHMLMTAMEMDRRGLAFSAVHDSFWTHACDVDEMNEALRDCFIDLYSRPLLQDLKESWELRYPGVIFPELPELGNLDLNEVKSAKYFFQ